MSDQARLHSCHRDPDKRGVIWKEGCTFSPCPSALGCPVTHVAARGSYPASAGTVRGQDMAASKLLRGSGEQCKANVALRGELRVHFDR